MRLAVFALPLLMAACVEGESPPAPGPDPAMPPIGECSADALQDLVGRSETVLQTMKFGATVRIIHPGQAVTMDYRPDRLNIEIDAGGKIARVFCG